MLIWCKCANFSGSSHYSQLGWQQSSQTLSDHHLDQHFQSLPGIPLSACRHFGGLLTYLCNSNLKYIVEYYQQTLFKEFVFRADKEKLLCHFIKKNNNKTHKINAPLNLALSCNYFGKHACCILRLTTNNFWFNANSVDFSW